MSFRIASIATMKGRESQLLQTVNSLENQVDLIHIYFNDSVSPELKEKMKVRCFNGSDLGDAGKFFNVPQFEHKENLIYFPCDDDIIFPPNYCDYMEAKAKQHGCPVSLHGRIIQTPVNSYYKSGIKFRCLDKVDHDIEVNVIGTGTLCFDTSKIKISLADFELKNMADIWFSIAAKKQGVKLMVVEHEKGFLKYQQVSNTIYEAMKNNDKTQTQIVNLML